LLYGEKHRLRVLLNTVWREIFWLEGEGVIGNWRKLHNEEFYGW
jgi:hypothetical protein